MLPDLRVGVAAVLTGLMLIIAAFGLAATVRLAQHAKIVPIEGPRALAYAEPDDWEVTAIRRRAFPIDKTSYDLLAALPGASPQPHALDMSPAAPATVRSIILRRAAIVTNTPVTNVVVNDTVAVPDPPKAPAPDPVPDTPEPGTSGHGKEGTIVIAAVPVKVELAAATVNPTVRRRLAFATTTPVTKVVANDTVAARQPLEPPAVTSVPDTGSVEPRISEHAEVETVVVTAVPEPQKAPALAPDPAPDTASLEPHASEPVKEETVVIASVPEPQNTSAQVSDPVPDTASLEPRPSEHAKEEPVVIAAVPEPRESSVLAPNPVSGSLEPRASVAVKEEIIVMAAVSESQKPPAFTPAPIMDGLAPATVSSIIRRRAAIAKSTNNVVANDAVAAPEPPAPVRDPGSDTGTSAPRQSGNAKDKTIVTATAPTKGNSAPAGNAPARPLDHALGAPKVQPSALTNATETRAPAKSANAKANKKAAPKQIAPARPADPWFPGFWPNLSQNRKDNWIFPAGNSEPSRK